MFNIQLYQYIQENELTSKKIFLFTLCCTATLKLIKNNITKATNNLHQTNKHQCATGIQNTNRLPGHTALGFWTNGGKCNLRLRTMV